MESEKGLVVTKRFPNLANNKFSQVYKARELEKGGRNLYLKGKRKTYFELLRKALQNSRMITSIVEWELVHADIPLDCNPNYDKMTVSSLSRGELIKENQVSFIFTRGSNYWVAYGYTPVEIADQFLEDRVGQQDIRVAGYFSSFLPQDCITYLDQIGVEVKQLSDLNALGIDTGDCRFVTDISELPEAKGYITSYHIDSVEGLAFFVNTLRESGVVD